MSMVLVCLLFAVKRNASQEQILFWGASLAVIISIMDHCNWYKQWVYSIPMPPVHTELHA